MMRIVVNEEIQSFFNRCRINMMNSLNEFWDTIQLNEKEKVKNLVKAIQEHEPDFGPENLIFDQNIMLDNPYFKNISLDEISEEGFEVKSVTMPKNILGNISWIKPDSKKELRDYIVLACPRKSVQIPVLVERNDVWMSPTLAEQVTIDPCVEKAVGNVLCFGCGIAYFPYMCAYTRSDKVKSITIVEKSKTVIEIFKKYIQPQFNTCIPIEIIEGDLFDYWNEEYISRFDYTFVDIWKDNEEGVEIICKILERYNPQENVDYWIEFSCYLPVRMFMCLYFDKLANGKLTELMLGMSGFNKKILKKIHKYFRGLDKTITTADEMKELMYSTKVIREILSIT